MIDTSILGKHFKYGDCFVRATAAWVTEYNEYLVSMRYLDGSAPGWSFNVNYAEFLEVAIPAELQSDGTCKITVMIPEEYGLYKINGNLFVVTEIEEGCRAHLGLVQPHHWVSFKEFGKQKNIRKLNV